MAKILEVIVTSVDEAAEAATGGADRLELVRALDVGGLTPDIVLIPQVLAAVKVPVRVMLRDQPCMSITSLGELRSLQARASKISEYPIDGLVMGFVRGHSVDVESMREICSAAPACPVTFHRAFDELPDPLAAIEDLKQIAQVDRILTTGGSGTWPERKNRLLEWQCAAAPKLKLLVGAGLCRAVLADLASTPGLEEFHLGRAARIPHCVEGKVAREAVRSLKSALG